MSRRSFDIKMKLEAVEYAEGHSGAAAAKKYNVDRQRIRDWRKQKETLKTLAATPEGCKRKTVEGGGRKVIFQKLESDLLNWIVEKRKLGEQVSRTATRMKAKILYEEIPDADKKMFKASEGWLQKFLDRNCLSHQNKATRIANRDNEHSDSGESSTAIVGEHLEMDTHIVHFPLTTHVLDVGQGVPGRNVSVMLYRQIGEVWDKIAESVTDTEGRCRGLISAANFQEGIYKLHFATGKYFQDNNIVGFYPFVEIAFEVKDRFSHYHVPLVISPYSYSTYRGS